jgi:hypothetical protein
VRERFVLVLCVERWMGWVAVVVVVVVDKNMGNGKLGRVWGMRHGYGG